MKKQNGITLVSLVIYIVIMGIVIAIMSTIINDFQINATESTTSTNSILEFNKFNSYFLKEVKTKNNEVDKIEKNDTTGEYYILFKSGNTFTFKDDSIYYNNIKICSNVEYFTAKTKENNNKIIDIEIEFSDFKKTITYKVENMY